MIDSLSMELIFKFACQEEKNYVPSRKLKRLDDYVLMEMIKNLQVETANKINMRTTY